MATEWTMLRVRRETHAELTAFIASLVRAADIGAYAIEARHESAITADEAIRVLLARDRQHRSRRSKSQATRRRAKSRDASSPLAGQE